MSVDLRGEIVADPDIAKLRLPRLWFTGQGPICEASRMILHTLHVTADAFTAETGWEIKPQGACKGDVCVPLGGAPFDVRSAAERLGMAVVEDTDLGVWALGPESVSGRALTSAEAPELVLPDLDGNPFQLSSLRGQKVALVSWAPY
jgi:hypothetical protein